MALAELEVDPGVHPPAGATTRVVSRIAELVSWPSRPDMWKSGEAAITVGVCVHLRGSRG